MSLSGLTALCLRFACIRSTVLCRNYHITAPLSASRILRIKLAQDEKFVLKTIPKPPKSVLSAFDYYYHEKRVEYEKELKNLAKKESASSDKPKAASKEKLRVEFEMMEQSQQQKYKDLAIEDAKRYQQELDLYEQEMNRTLTVRQLVDWLQSLPGRAMAQRIMRHDSRKEDSGSDQNRIKKPRNAYMYFTQHYIHNVDRFKKHADIAQVWHSLSEEEKAPFRRMHEEDKKRYYAEKSSRS